MMLALAQSIQSDDLVIEEARQSIGSYPVGELDWLEELTNLAIECRKLQDGEVELQPAVAAQPGDVAVHKSKQNWDLRVVVSSDNQYISLIRLGREKDPIMYTSGHLGVAQLAAFRDSS